jgi:hypothetical protein
MNTKVSINGQMVREHFADQLATGRAFFVGISDTRNADYKQLILVQEASFSDGPQDINQLLLGWKNTNLLFCWRNVSTAIISPVMDKLKPGMFLDEVMALITPAAKGMTFNLRLEEYTQETNPALFITSVVRPEQEGRTGASPKINPETNEVITYNSKPIYRTVEVVAGEANHVRLKDGNNSASESAEAQKPSPFVD